MKNRLLNGIPDQYHAENCAWSSRVDGGQRRGVASWNPASRLAIGSAIHVICVLMVLEARAVEYRTNRLSLLDVVQITLQKDPVIQIEEQQVEFAKGVLQEASGQFDLSGLADVSRSYFRNPLTDANHLRYDTLNRPYLDARRTLETDEMDYRVGAKQQFRSGITLSPGVTLNQVRNNFDQQRTVNRAEVNFVVKVPLLQGFGREAVGAAEKAAQLRREATILDLQHTIASRVLASLGAYWECVAAQLRLEVLGESRTRSEEFLARIKELVEADEYPAAEVKQVQADLAEKNADFTSAEQEFWDARQNLGLALGLSVAEMANAPVPSDSFPVPTGDVKNTEPRAESLISESLVRRADYQSAVILEQAAQYCV
ncbi:MAG: TolC family protein [Pedosphaera sp.]|nr:TolC family protein [Pedosphaera sp.]